MRHAASPCPSYHLGALPSLTPSPRTTGPGAFCFALGAKAKRRGYAAALRPTERAQSAVRHSTRPASKSSQNAFKRPSVASVLPYPPGANIVDSRAILGAAKR